MLEDLISVTSDVGISYGHEIKSRIPGYVLGETGSNPSSLLDSYVRSLFARSLLTLHAVGAVLYAAVAGPFRGDWGADTYKHHIIYSLLRKMITRLNTAQMQYVVCSGPR